MELTINESRVDGKLIITRTAHLSEKEEKQVRNYLAEPSQQVHINWAIQEAKEDVCFKIVTDCGQSVEVYGKAVYDVFGNPGFHGYDPADDIEEDIEYEYTGSEDGLCVIYGDDAYEIEL